jgi:hypothetical protein
MTKNNRLKPPTTQGFVSTKPFNQSQWSGIPETCCLTRQLRNVEDTPNRVPPLPLGTPIIIYHVATLVAGLMAGRVRLLEIVYRKPQ